jgi:hypothetical protein
VQAALRTAFGALRKDLPGPIRAEADLPEDEAGLARLLAEAWPLAAEAIAKAAPE